MEKQMMVNYHNKLKEIIANLNGTPKLLLHSCCGPCSTTCISFLTKFFDITVFYYNPNIEPEAEYLKRKQEQIKFLENFTGQNKISFLDFDYDIENVELLKCFVRGLFMGSGSINNPKSKYHLECSVKNEDVANIIVRLMEENDIFIKQRENIIYIKEGEEISKFLAFIGASKSVLEFEEIRVQRSMNNKVNRIVNCKAANLNKVLNASVEQIDAIRKLKQNGKFEKLDDSLKEIANLRLEYPDMPLSELGSKLSNPVGKSGVNYRLKKIIKIANNEN